jgi:hypothetical protein
MTTHERPTILVVEDGRSTREMYEYTLRMERFEGGQVDSSHSGVGSDRTIMASLTERSVPLRRRIGSPVPLIALSLLSSLCVSSCGEGVLPAASPVPTSVIPQLASPRDHNVNWEGTTSDGLGIGFQMSRERVTGIYVELPQVQGDVCMFGVGGFSLDGFDNFDLVWGPAGPPITDGAFTVVSIAPISASYGTTEASASIDFTLKGRVNGSSGEGTGDFRFSTKSTSASCVAKRQVAWNIVKKGD